MHTNNSNNVNFIHSDRWILELKTPLRSTQNKLLKESRNNPAHRPHCRWRGREFQVWPCHLGQQRLPAVDSLGVEGRVQRCSLRVEGREFLKFTPAIWAHRDICLHSTGHSTETLAHNGLTGGGGEGLEV